MDAGPEAWEEISCNFLQVSLKSELQGLDGGLDGGPRFWIAVASQALTLCCFALFLLLAPIPGNPGRQKEGLPLHVLVLLGLTTGMDFFCTDQYQPSMPKISRQFGVDPEAVGSTIQVHLMSCALTMLCAGHWIRKRGMRQMILWCQLFLASGALGCAFAPSFGWFVVGRVLQGISASSSVAVSAMLTASYSDPEELRRASNKVACVALLAHIAGPATGGLIAWAFGNWQVSFLAVFGLTVLNTLANYLLLPDVRADEEPPKADQPQGDGVLRRQLLVLLGLSLLRGSSYVAQMQEDGGSEGTSA